MSAPGGRWKHVSAKTAESWGFKVRKDGYPWVAYKGIWDDPHERHFIPTDEEVEAREARRAKSRAAAESPRMRTPEEVYGPTEAFVVKEYIGSDGPTLKGNGFDGLRIGDTREEAEAFVDWINVRLP